MSECVYLSLLKYILNLIKMPKHNLWYRFRSFLVNCENYNLMPIIRQGISKTKIPKTEENFYNHNSLTGKKS